MKITKLPELPNSWTALALAIALIYLRSIGVDTWVTATLSMLIGYLVGVKMEQARYR